MKRFSGYSAIAICAIVILSASLFIKTIQFAFILTITEEKGATVEALAFAVSKVYGGGVNETQWVAKPDGTVISKGYTMGSFEADRGLRIFAFIYLCLWIVIGVLALISLLVNRFMLIMMINMVVFMLGLCAESFLTVTIGPRREGDGTATSIMSSFFTYCPLLIDCITNFTLITYCCWLTKNGMTFEPNEQGYEEQIRGRKHKMSESSTFRSFDVVDG